MEGRRRIEVEFEMPMRLEAIDAQHTDQVALLHGPMALFAMRDTDSALGLTRAQLLNAQPISSGSEWRMISPAGEVQLKPFVNIHNGRYRLYQQVTA